MPEFDLPRLIVARQQRVLQALRELSEDKALVKALHPDARDRLLQCIAAGAPLDLAHALPPLLLDNTTDSVVGALLRVVTAIEDGLDDRIVPLDPKKAARRDAARLVHQRAFPIGVPFLSDTMPLQYRAMRTLADTLGAADCVKAVATLGLEYLVEHFEAHLAPYGRAVKTTDNRDVEADSDRFHAALVALAMQVTVHHGGTPIEKQLMAAYDTELEAQRTEEREARRARAARKRGDKPA